MVYASAARPLKWSFRFYGIAVYLWFMDFAIELINGYHFHFRVPGHDERDEHHVSGHLPNSSRRCVRSLLVLSQTWSWWLYIGTVFSSMLGLGRFH